MPRPIGSAATASTWRSISPPAARASRRSPKPCGAGSRICSASTVDHRAAHRTARAPLTWYVGLDADATRIGDTMWNGEELDETSQARVVGLFRLTFRDAAVMLDKVRGEPVYLILAMTPDKLIRMKPQNLVTGLPVRHLEAVR